MAVLAVNGSPRKKWNTATLLEKALEGAASRGAEVELVHLYDLKFKGCRSCFACKTVDGPSYGRCAARDGLTSLLDKVRDADALILGSPIYFGTVTGEMRSFMERLVFPYMTYTDPPGSLFSGKIPTGFVYTLGATREMAEERGYSQHIGLNNMLLTVVFGSSETLIAYDTYQFEDYSRVYAPRFDPAEKARVRADVFPMDCQKAFDMGRKFAEEGQSGWVLV